MDYIFRGKLRLRKSMKLFQEPMADEESLQGLIVYEVSGLLRASMAFRLLVQASMAIPIVPPPIF